jgi:hypothetical protein
MKLITRHGITSYIQKAGIVPLPFVTLDSSAAGLPAETGYPVAGICSMKLHQRLRILQNLQPDLPWHSPPFAMIWQRLIQPAVTLSYQIKAPKKYNYFRGKWPWNAYKKGEGTADNSACFLGNIAC